MVGEVEEGETLDISSETGFNCEGRQGICVSWFAARELSKILCFRRNDVAYGCIGVFAFFRRRKWRFCVESEKKRS